MSEKLFKKQKYNINYEKSYDDEAQNQREHIAKIIIFFDIIFVLQYKFVEIIRECKIAFQCY